MKTTRKITYGAIIAAVYVALCLVFAPISYGLIQVRIAEALSILPFFTPVAIPGLFVGCIVANLIGGLGIYDIIFGSLATLAAAICAYLLRRNKWLVPLPAVVINAIVIGYILHYILGLETFVLAMLYVGIGQLIACYGLGMPLLLVLEKRKKLFKLQ